MRQFCRIAGVDPLPSNDTVTIGDIVHVVEDLTIAEFHEMLQTRSMVAYSNAMMEHYRSPQFRALQEADRQRTLRAQAELRAKGR